MKIKCLMLIGLILCCSLVAVRAQASSVDKDQQQKEIVDERIKTIDEEISFLNDVVEKYSGLANMRDRRAQKYMLTDFASYTREMEAAADYNKLALETENTIQELKKLKMKLQSESK